MTDRERLIELLQGARDKYINLLPFEKELIADHLLANGVIVLPCKVGDTVWIKGDRFPAEIECINITASGLAFEYVEYDRSPELTEVWDGGIFEVEDIGKTVFLTREEEEAALKEGE